MIALELCRPTYGSNDSCASAAANLRAVVHLFDLPRLLPRLLLTALLDVVNAEDGLDVPRLTKSRDDVLPVPGQDWLRLVHLLRYDYRRRADYLIELHPFEEIAVAVCDGQPRLELLWDREVVQHAEQEYRPDSEVRQLPVELDLAWIGPPVAADVQPRDEDDSNGCDYARTSGLFDLDLVL